MDKKQMKSLTSSVIRTSSLGLLTLSTLLMTVGCGGGKHSDPAREYADVKKDLGRPHKRVDDFQNILPENLGLKLLNADEPNTEHSVFNFVRGQEVSFKIVPTGFTNKNLAFELKAKDVPSWASLVADSKQPGVWILKGRPPQLQGFGFSEKETGVITFYPDFGDTFSKGQAHPYQGINLSRSVSYTVVKTETDPVIKRISNLPDKSSANQTITFEIEVAVPKNDPAHPPTLRVLGPDDNGKEIPVMDASAAVINNPNFANDPELTPQGTWIFHRQIDPNKYPTPSAKAFLNSSDTPGQASAFVGMKFVAKAGANSSAMLPHFIQLAFVSALPVIEVGDKNIPVIFNRGESNSFTFKAHLPAPSKGELNVDTNDISKQIKALLKTSKSTRIDIRCRNISASTTSTDTADKSTDKTVRDKECKLVVQLACKTSTELPGAFDLNISASNLLFGKASVMNVTRNIQIASAEASPKCSNSSSTNTSQLVGAVRQSTTSTADVASKSNGAGKNRASKSSKKSKSAHKTPSKSSKGKATKKGDK